MRITKATYSIIEAFLFLTIIASLLIAYLAFTNSFSSKKSSLGASKSIYIQSKA